MSFQVRSDDNNYSRKALAFISLNALVWWLLFSLGRSSLDTYGDMAEAYSWGISWQWGYDKHPPLSGWMAAAWFELFPASDWAYYLLAMINQAIAFWFIFLAGKRWLTPAQALLAVMLTSLVPLFGPDTGFKFNANSAMLPWVAIFSWSLLAALQTGAKRYVFVAGIAAGAACLVKYWAPLMLSSITLGTILIVFQSKTLTWRPTLGRLLAVSGLTMLVFFPHFSWAVTHHWPGLRYAHAAHNFVAGTSSAASLLDLLTDISLVALLPTLAWGASILYIRTTFGRHAAEVTTQSPADVPPRPSWFLGLPIFVFATLLTIESAHLAGVTVASKWLIPAWLFFAWSLCTVTPQTRNAQRLIRPLGWIIGLYWLGLFGYVAYINPSLELNRDVSNERHVVADEVTQVFHRKFGQPLRFIAGNDALSFSAAFYSTDHPVAVADLDFTRTTWVDEASVRKAGVAVLCDASHPECIKTTVDLLGSPQLRSEWKGLADDGKSTSVVELFYAPRSMAHNRYRPSHRPI
ncbi:glycosyltransferase family 39 protein [Rhodoferax sp.]|uniref:glycosyltransferase family 39 protein n=1 Tax=Rhodoferax sp. TaxID=50421 RepID=UPI00283DC347|nr:glycosyltransferase family 39 protein [Rhodoferax sp.]MDR3369999.1 glycosyltransferase family 39 protein [Rhodoferax sp.]